LFLILTLSDIFAHFIYISALRKTYRFVLLSTVAWLFTVHTLFFFYTNDVIISNSPNLTSDEKNKSDYYPGRDANRYTVVLKLLRGWNKLFAFFILVYYLQLKGWRATATYTLHTYLHQKVLWHCTMLTWCNDIRYDITLWLVLWIQYR